MASRVARHVLETVGCILAVGVVPSTGLPQLPSERAWAEESERLANDIRAAQAEEGPGSAALIVPLTELGALYEADGEHALATAALEQARQIVRANYGLYTLDQAPLIQKTLDNQQALGNIEMVKALDEGLFALAERHPEDLRTVAIHRDIGMRKLDLLRRLRAGQAPKEIYGENVFSYSHARSVLEKELTSEAQIHLADAAVVILRNGLYSSDELRDLEMEIIRSSDLFRQQARHSERRWSPIPNVVGDREYAVGEIERIGTLEELGMRTVELWALTGSDPSRYDPDVRGGRAIATWHQLGRESYLRLIAYDEAAHGDSATGVEALRTRLEAYLHLADWDLLYSANGGALDEYERLHGLLTTSGAIAEPLIAESFAPPMPIVLPTFLPNPLQTEPSARYIDVAFEITRYGEARGVDILDIAPNVPDAATSDLARLIKGSRFRPRIVDGELGRASRVVVRYHLGD